MSASPSVETLNNGSIFFGPVTHGTPALVNRIMPESFREVRVVRGGLYINGVKHGAERGRSRSRGDAQPEPQPEPKSISEPLVMVCLNRMANHEKLIANLDGKVAVLNDNNGNHATLLAAHGDGIEQLAALYRSLDSDLDAVVHDLQTNDSSHSRIANDHLARLNNIERRVCNLQGSNEHIGTVLKNSNEIVADNVKSLLRHDLELDKVRDTQRDHDLELDNLRLNMHCRDRAIQELSQELSVHRDHMNSMNSMSSQTKTVDPLSLVCLSRVGNYEKVLAAMDKKIEATDEKLTQRCNDMDAELTRTDERIVAATDWLNDMHVIVVNNSHEINSNSHEINRMGHQMAFMMGRIEQLTSRLTFLENENEKQALEIKRLSGN